MLVLGLGSNCGDRLEYLRYALHYLQYEIAPEVLEVKAISPLYESDALLPEGAPKDWDQPFLNANILCDTNLNPPELLQLIKGIETKIGRKNRGRWAPREIDIDILIMGNKGQFTYTSETLKVPHPSLLERPFALLPLVDLVPHWIIPLPGPFQGMTAEHYVSRWKRSWETIPFRTRRSPLCFSQLVGILNITPDSFSDGGLHSQLETALTRIQTLIQDGIRTIDIGAESTRPGARSLDTEEEWSRLQALLQAIGNERKDSHLFFGQNIRFSIDTRNPEIAVRTIRLGADWINDVTGLESSAMREAVAGSTVPVKVVIMHSLTVPPIKDQTLSPDRDPIEQLIEWGKARIQSLVRSGIARNRIIFDPGLGFGKTAQQSWEILRRAHELHKLGVPILIGHSRKSFLTALPTLKDSSPQERDIETTLLTVELIKKGITYLRVHNGEQNTRALKLWAQMDGVSRW